MLSCENIRCSDRVPALPNDTNNNVEHSQYFEEQLIASVADAVAKSVERGKASLRKGRARSRTNCSKLRHSVKRTFESHLKESNPTAAALFEAKFQWAKTIVDTLIKLTVGGDLDSLNANLQTAIHIIKDLLKQGLAWNPLETHDDVQVLI